MSNYVWSGYLTFGLVSIPVRLLPGARRENISFRMLNPHTKTPIRQQLYSPEEARVVERAEVLKGYEFRRDEYIPIAPEEIEQLRPRSAQAMEILEFIRLHDIDPIYFDTSYLLVPQDPGRHPYSVLRRAMQQASCAAIGKLCMRNREYTAVVRPYQNGLALHTLFYENEVRRLDSEDIVREVKAPEVQVAQQLVQALMAAFDPHKYRDDFKENLKNLIAVRMQASDRDGHRAEKLPVPDLITALKESLARAKKPPQRRGSQRTPARMA